MHLVSVSQSRAVVFVRLVDGASNTSQALLRAIALWGEPVQTDFERGLADARRQGRDYSAALLWAAEPVRREVET